jgi:hypothetical protein
MHLGTQGMFDLEDALHVGSAVRAAHREHGPQTEVMRECSDRETMAAAGATEREHATRATPDHVPEDEFEFARLVAAEDFAGAVVALDPNG